MSGRRELAELGVCFFFSWLRRGKQTHLSRLELHEADEFSFFSLRTIEWCYYHTQKYFNTVLLAPDDPEHILRCGLIKSEGFLNIAVVFICPHADRAS